MNDSSAFYMRQIMQNKLSVYDRLNRKECKGTATDKYKKDAEVRKRLEEEIHKKHKKHEGNEKQEKQEKYKKADNEFTNLFNEKQIPTDVTNDPIIENEQLKKKDINKGLPGLNISSDLLKERAYLINNNESLYNYNGKCYDYIDSKGIVKLYRKKVDYSLSGEKSMNTIMQLHTFLCTDDNITVKKFVDNQRIAVLNNGIYDVIQEKLKPHKPSEIVLSYIDADYVEQCDCKHFDKFLNDVTGGNKLLQKRLWMFLGYTFMQTTEKKLFFVMGEAPDSGKSLLGNFIESLYSDKYVSNIALNDFNKEFSLAPIVGSAVNISLDLPASRLNSIAISKLKMLTGGDTITIKQKFVPEFSYENRAKLIFATNSPISIAENDDAFWNRLIYLPFDYTVPKVKQNGELSRIFQYEKNAIVSKALRYAKELINTGFEFPTTPLIERRMREWRGYDNVTIESFLQECCIIGQENKGELLDNLYLEYENYCDNTGYVPKNRFLFKKFLEDQIGLKHFKMRDGGANPQSALRGIRLNGSGNYGNYGN